MKDSILLNVSTNGLENVLKTHDFIFRTDKLNLDSSKNYKCALLSYSLWYSWYNITNTNNKFRYKTPTSALTTITLPNGNYGVSDLNSYISNYLLGIGESASGIKFVGNYNTLRVDLTLETGFQVDFSVGVGSFQALFGFNAQLYTASTSGQSAADISGGVDALLINCSILDASKNITNNSTTSTLHFLTPKVGPGSNIAESIPSPVYLPISVKGHINSIQFSITSQTGTLLDLNNENVSLSIHILEM